MKLLLDTHSLLWYADGSPRLSAIASRLILDPANSLYLSVASVWEVAIKSNLKKLQLQNGFEHFLSRAISLCGIHLMDVTLDDCVEYIADDELVEITPKTIRIRKRFLLEHERKRASRVAA